MFISGIFWAGDSSKILEMADKRVIESITSVDILDELSSALCYPDLQDKVEDKELEMRWTIEDILSFSTMVKPWRKVSVVSDPDDDMIVECAVAGRADFIVSQDRHLLKIREFEGIKIVTPTEFLKIMGLHHKPHSNP